MLFQNRRLSDSLDSALVDGVPFALTGIFAAILDHFFGILDVMLVLTSIMWGLYMVAGMLRAVMQAWIAGGLEAAVGALDDKKAAEGMARGIAVALAVIMLGLVEIAQVEVSGGGYMPLVAPMLGIAFGWFALQVAGSIQGLHKDLGAAVKKLLGRARQGKPPDD